MKNLIIFLFVLVLLGCKETIKDPVKIENTDSTTTQKSIPVKDIIKNFGANLDDGNTIVFDLNLAMEDFIRVDSIFVKKQDGDVFISASTADKVLELDDDFSKQQVPWKEYSKKHSDTLSLEHFFSQNLDRVEKKNAQVYTAKIFTESDTINLYTYDLADKARFIMRYFEVMHNIFPKEKKFESKNQMFPE